MEREILMIIDGNALLHRAWHAIPPLTTRSGEIVNAAYGFISILIKAIKDLRPSHVVVTFDRKAPTFRHIEYAEYKAKREKKPQELYDQIERIKQILGGFSIPIYEKDGFEADDVIATICARVHTGSPALDIIIVTGDLDTLQLVSPQTRIYTLQRGISDTIVYDEKMVGERFDGLTPADLKYVKALRGDPSDNIPGAKGIGEKTALALVKEFHTVGNLYEQLHKGVSTDIIKKSVQEKLLASEKAVLQSLRLVQLVDDVPIEWSLDDCRFGPVDTKKLFGIFQELEFHSLIPRLSDFSSGPTQAEEGSTARYQALTDERSILAILDEAKKAGVFALDTETTSLNPFHAELLGMSLCMEEGTAYYIVWSTRGDQWKQKIESLLKDEAVGKVGHHLKYDIEVLLAHGIAVRGIRFDTLLAAYVLNPGQREYGLDALSFSEFGHQKIPISSLIGTGKNQRSMADVPLSEIAPYACEDADFTFRLYQRYRQQLSGTPLETVLTTIELPLLRPLIEMERNGILIDGELLKEVSREIKQRISLLEEKIYTFSEGRFNINSPIQLKKILFDKLELGAKLRIRKGKTGLSTAASELEKMRALHPIIPALLEYRELFKLLNTYVGVLPDLIEPATGRIHTSFNQTITATGRLSSSEPNLQNIPIRNDLGREIRKAFIAEKGYQLVAADYSQVELRIIASLANDEKMIKVFRAGKDIHTITAAEINCIPPEEVTPDLRRAAKEVNFGILYGMGAQGLAQSAGIPFGAAQQFIDQYFLAYPAVREYLNKTIEDARKTSYVETLFGRRRYVPEIQSSVQQVRAAAERAAVNMPIQGTEADIMKLAMIRVYDCLLDMYPGIEAMALSAKPVRMMLQVHDELLLEVANEEVENVLPMLKKEMEAVAELKAPLVVDLKVGSSWGDLKKI